MGHDFRLLSVRLDGAVRRQPDLLLVLCRPSGARQSVARAIPRVAGADAGAGAEFRAGPPGSCRPLRLRHPERAAGGRPGWRGGRDRWRLGPAPARPTGPRVRGPVALVFGLATCLFQGYELWHLGFGLTEGGYPSAFAGLSSAWVIQFGLATAWLASIVMQAGPAGDTVARRQPASFFVWILLFLA